MYNVHVKKYTVSMVRERLSEALDEAQRGEPVFIQRQGVEYRLTVEPARPRRKKTAASRIEIVDPAVSSGQWTWDSTASGALKFRSRRRS
jgi:antitoxin (DNA-binding transcriptional repressor) of toxin-antitoxin stability system